MKKEFKTIIEANNWLKRQSNIDVCLEQFIPTIIIRYEPYETPLVKLANGSSSIPDTVCEVREAIDED